MRPGAAVALLALQVATASAWAAPPADQPVDHPVPASAQALAARCSQGLQASRRELAALERRRVDDGWLQALDRFQAAVEDRSTPLTFLSAVHPDPAIRQAAEACELRFARFYASFNQSRRLYAALKRVPVADAVDAALVAQLRQGFEDAGVDLPPDLRRKARALNDRIVALGQRFDRRIRDEQVRLPYTEAELAGVPPGVWKAAPRDAQGRVLLGISAPEWMPVLQTAEQPTTRERMWRAKQNEGGAANLKLLAEIVQLRKQYASLFGEPSWASFVIRRNMAGSPEQVQRFLDEVKAAVEGRERAELLELQQAKAEHLQLAGPQAQAIRVERWDRDFYLERVRQARYRVDQEAFRAHFPPEQSLQFALRLVERLLGVRYERLPQARAWHPEVQTYAVSDAATGRPLGLLRVDLYPREGKYNHAAVWPLRSSSQRLGRTSAMALVVNFDRQGLTLDELETLLHELGHAVHGNLSAARWTPQGGLSVVGDFVEAPSQMLEDWVYDPEVLKLFAEVCPACKPVPPELLAQATAARHFGKGLLQSRQHLFASYDLALYGPEPPQDVLALWQRLEGATPQGHVAGTMFPAGFSHIATNYSAGYYGYLWSLVVAMDLRSAFQGRRLDAALGARYREAVLAPGRQRPPQALLRDFLGRDFSPQAFFEDLKR